MLKKLISIVLIITMSGISSMVVASKANLPMGDVLNTNITAHINGVAIPSYNIAGNTMVVVEDLMRYGFDVEWDADVMTLAIVGYNADKPVSPLPIENNSMPTGSVRCQYLSTDIKTYVKGKEVAGYNIGGQTLIQMDELAAYGSIYWDGTKNELIFDNLLTRILDEKTNRYQFDYKRSRLYIGKAIFDKYELTNRHILKFFDGAEFMYDRFCEFFVMDERFETHIYNAFSRNNDVSSNAYMVNGETSYEENMFAKYLSMIDIGFPYIVAHEVGHLFTNIHDSNLNKRNRAAAGSVAWNDEVFAEIAVWCLASSREINVIGVNPNGTAFPTWRMLEEYAQRVPRTYRVSGSQEEFFFEEFVQRDDVPFSGYSVIGETNGVPVIILQDSKTSAFEHFMTNIIIKIIYNYGIDVLGAAFKEMAKMMDDGELVFDNGIYYEHLFEGTVMTPDGIVLDVSVPVQTTLWGWRKFNAFLDIISEKTGDDIRSVYFTEGELDVIRDVGSDRWCY